MIWHSILGSATGANVKTTHIPSTISMELPFPYCKLVSLLIILERQSFTKPPNTLDLHKERLGRRLPAPYLIINFQGCCSFWPHSCFSVRPPAPHNQSVPQLTRNVQGKGMPGSAYTIPSNPTSESIPLGGALCSAGVVLLHTDSLHKNWLHWFIFLIER